MSLGNDSFNLKEETRKQNLETLNPWAQGFRFPRIKWGFEVQGS